MCGMVAPRRVLARGGPLREMVGDILSTIAMRRGFSDSGAVTGFIEMDRTGAIRGSCPTFPDLGAKRSMP